MAKKAAAKSSGGASVPASRLKSSTLLDTRVVYCGDNLEYQKNFRCNSATTRLKPLTLTRWKHKNRHSGSRLRPLPHKAHRLHRNLRLHRPRITIIRTILRVEAVFMYMAIIEKMARMLAHTREVTRAGELITLVIASKLP